MTATEDDDEQTILDSEQGVFLGPVITYTPSFHPTSDEAWRAMSSR